MAQKISKATMGLQEYRQTPGHIAAAKGIALDCSNTAGHCESPPEQDKPHMKNARNNLWSAGSHGLEEQMC